jgi:hypothetical protein
VNVTGLCRPLEQPLRPHHWRCLACPHRITAMTERAAIDALNLHQHYAHSGAPKEVREC